MTVRTHLPWPWRVGLGVALIGIVAGMWWWGFDFGQFLGGFNRRAVVETQVRLEADLAAANAENARLRTKAAELESELNVTRGAQATLSRQALDLQNENTQMQEELAVLRTLTSETGKPGMVSIQRVAAERDHGDVYHFSMLVVRGGKPSDDFAGQVALVANVSVDGRTTTLMLPDDQPETAPALALRFKYYQRVEGTFRVPQGGELKSLQARVLETGQTAPSATRSLNLS
jgi:hypothetical protein